MESYILEYRVCGYSDAAVFCYLYKEDRGSISAKAEILPFSCRKEEIPELPSYMEDVMPKKKDRFHQQDQILDAHIQTDDYLPFRSR